MKKLILISLLSVGIAGACDTENCKDFIQASNDLKKVYGIKKLDKKILKNRLKNLL